MLHIPVSEFKNGISETINRVAYGGESVLLQRHGKDVVALVSLEQLRLLEEIERREEQDDTKAALGALEQLGNGKDELIPWSEAKAQLKNARKGA